MSLHTFTLLMVIRNTLLTMRLIYFLKFFLHPTHHKNSSVTMITYAVPPIVPCTLHLLCLGTIAWYFCQSTTSMMWLWPGSTIQPLFLSSVCQSQYIMATSKDLWIQDILDRQLTGATVGMYAMCVWMLVHIQRYIACQLVTFHESCSGKLPRQFAAQLDTGDANKLTQDWSGCGNSASSNCSVTTVLQLL